MAVAMRWFSVLKKPITRLHKPVLAQVPPICSYSSSSDDGIKREGLPISRFPIPERNTLPLSVQERMNTVEEKAGFLPNVFSALAYHPKEFECFFQYYDVLMEENTGSLTKAEKELVVVVTSAKNNCLYCVVAHSAVHRILSKNPYLADQVATNPEFADLTPRERAIADFAVKVSQMEPLQASDFEELQRNGLSNDDAWYIGAITAFFAMSNRLAHFTAMRPNEEFYAMGHGSKPKK